MGKSILKIGTRVSKSQLLHYSGVINFVIISFLCKILIKYKFTTQFVFTNVENRSSVFLTM